MRFGVRCLTTTRHRVDQHMPQHLQRPVWMLRTGDREYTCPWCGSIHRLTDDELAVRAGAVAVTPEPPKGAL